MIFRKLLSALLLPVALVLLLPGCSGSGDTPASLPAPVPTASSAPESGAVPEQSTEALEPAWIDEFGIPDDAALLAPETSCEEFSHVNHLPWDERPSACPIGDWCMKKDEGVFEGAVTWYGLPRVSKYASITCKIGNKCYRFVGNNNCHYDLYDPDLNATLMPNETVPWARKDGHSYLNFRVRLPDSDTIYNFMSTTAEATRDASEAVYCPADVYAPHGVEPLLFDPRQGDQSTGCGTDAPYIGLFGDAREAIPYDMNQRDDYDWTYLQPGEQ